ncbi:hypothetical protein AAG570_010033 [Ranatra chinensis]|uniref:Uncharacterized protein n=1 Tax=Ranatra chinensis TaxID=642074 RepID=A0ABD0YLE2_9HEMI
MTPEQANMVENVTCLSTAVVTCLSTAVITCLSTAVVTCLSTAVITCLSTAIVTCLSTAVVTCLSTAVVTCLSTAVVTCLSTAVITCLSTAIVTCLSTAVITCLSTAIVTCLSTAVVTCLSTAVVTCLSTAIVTCLSTAVVTGPIATHEAGGEEEEVRPRATASSSSSCTLAAQLDPLSLLINNSYFAPGPRCLITTCITSLRSSLTHDTIRGCESVADMHRQIVETYRPEIEDEGRVMLNSGVSLLGNNARPHTARVTQRLVVSFGLGIVTHPPISHHLALFSNIPCKCGWETKRAQLAQQRVNFTICRTKGDDLRSESRLTESEWRVDISCSSPQISGHSTTASTLE